MGFACEKRLIRLPAPQISAAFPVHCMLQSVALAGAPGLLIVLSQSRIKFLRGTNSKRGIDLQHSYRKGGSNETTIGASGNEKQVAHSSIFDTSVLIPLRSAKSEAGFNSHAANTGVGCGTQRAERGRITSGLKMLKISITEKCWA